MIPLNRCANQPADDTGAEQIQVLPLSRIRPSPENERLYRPVDAGDEEIVALARSIRENGIQEPLIVSADHCIISGHRRHTAARLAGLQTVPCRIHHVSRRENPEQFLRLLRECNRQRIKTLAEAVREECISANPQQTYQALIEHRRKSGMTDFSPLEIGDRKKRKAISRAKIPFLQAVLKVMDERRDFWPLSDRQIHYALLNAPPLIHASKPASTYVNEARSYGALVDLLTRARLDGSIPFNAIADETRPVITWNVFADASAYVRSELDGLFAGYWRDLLQSQPNHIELVVEKNTLISILRPVAEQYCLPMTSGRGFASLPPRKAIAQRYRASGKEKLVLLIVSDFDPDGEMIAASFTRSMRDDFGVDNLAAMKVALTAEQVRAYRLPVSGKAKALSRNYERFVSQYGQSIHELEALAPRELQRLTRQAIDAVLDLEAFNHELDRERADSVELTALRRRAVEAVEGSLL